MIGVDVFDEVAGGADAYLLSDILMDCDDPSAERLLRNCRVAMGERGLLLVVERAIPADDRPSFNLAGLGTTGGRARSELELDRLFEAAGLERTIHLRTPSGYSILEARTRASW